MKFLINNSNQPLLQLNDGRVINLNTLEETTETEYRLVKVGKELKLSNEKNEDFISKAGRVFSVSKIIKAYGINWYKLESNIVLLVAVNGDTLQLLGNYPIHYIKLLYRYINSL